MITIDNLTFGYKKKKTLYRDFSFYLEPGCVCGLLGSNGVGKSTLLYLICGLLRPQKGEVIFRGFSSFRRLPVQTKELFFVPEEFDLPNGSLSRFLEANAGLYPHFNLQELEKNLQVFGMNMDLNLGALSMGQKKKVYISFALATGASLLIMDEPTNGLDIPGKSQFRKLIAQNMNDRRSILISTHQVADIDKMLDRILIIDHEGIQLDESVSTLCEKLHFVEHGNPHEYRQVLYSMPTLEGCGLVVVNEKSKESILNLELLFHAISENKEAVKSALSNSAISAMRTRSLKNTHNEESTI